LIVVGSRCSGLGTWTAEISIHDSRVQLNGKGNKVTTARVTYRCASISPSQLFHQGLSSNCYIDAGRTLCESCSAIMSIVSSASLLRVFLGIFNDSPDSEVGEIHLTRQHKCSRNRVQETALSYCKDGRGLQS
jgi:hypothetical protein